MIKCYRCLGNYGLYPVVVCIECKEKSMAIMKVCSVYDVKAEAFMPPQFVPAVGIATRDFTDAFTGEGAKMAKHKADFDLYHVADFDTGDGHFESVIPPKLVIKGSDVGE